MPQPASSDFGALQSVTSSLLAYCRSQHWSGWDPYDGLNSRFFRAVPFLHNKAGRLAFIQFMKRSPVNLRRLLGVPPGRNPKGTALFASAIIRLSRLGLADPSEARALLDLLAVERCAGHRHACWGYHFDWQTRGILVSKSTPNIICTTFAGHAFLDLFEITHQESDLAMAFSAARYIVDELAAGLPEEAFCIRYFTIGSSSVHNANLLGAAFLARVFTHSEEPAFRAIALKAVQYSVQRQAPDGSWPYGEDAKQRWVDSFHTAYNLLALERIRRDLRQDSLAPVITKGYGFFLDHFFPPGGTVNYFPDRHFPVDSHAIATALITLVELREYDSRSIPAAQRVFQWAVDHMRDPRGWFYYQKRRWLIVKIPYMRWTQAWMLLATSSLLAWRNALSETPRESCRPAC